ncbi:putative cysteine protease [Podosphaera aphanis]|nr:putative cysteine protease [Podosphaera aphanis]
MAAVNFSRCKRLVQSFWDPEPVNDTSNLASIWCLGVEYNSIQHSCATVNTPDSASPLQKATSPTTSRPATPPQSISSSLRSTPCNDSASEDASWPSGFLDDFESKITFTYRMGFPAIPRTRDDIKATALSLSVLIRSHVTEGVGFTSDTGWGCMIRSGQSLLANALIILKLGRDWRRGSSISEERKIISLFADDPRSPYSIHKFVEHGEVACGKHPGDWFGPSATARCIQALTKAHEPSDLRIYLARDGSEVHEDSFLGVAKPDGNVFKPTLILVGTRLGLDQVTPVYWETLKAYLKMSQSLGIVGGQPSSSHYFIGIQDSHFFYLDPHYTQTTLRFSDSPDEYSQEDIDTCHTRRLRMIDVKRMDPSMLIAFLIRNDNDWREWQNDIREIQSKAIIHITDKNPHLENHCGERNGAIEEVETFDDDDDSNFNA